MGSDSINLGDAKANLAFAWIDQTNQPVKPDPRFITFKMSIKYWKPAEGLNAVESELEMEAITAEH